MSLDPHKSNKLFEILQKVSVLEMDIERAEKQIIKLFESPVEIPEKPLEYPLNVIESSIEALKYIRDNYAQKGGVSAIIEQTNFGLEIPVSKDPSPALIDKGGFELKISVSVENFQNLEIQGRPYY